MKKKVTRTHEEFLKQKEQRKINHTCPECKYYSDYNYNTTLEGWFRICEFYTCCQCGCQWKIKIKL